VNIVGDHATYHADLDAPLQSDIAALASALEGSVEFAKSSDDVAECTARAIVSSYGPPGRVATLIVPADVSWGRLTSPPDLWPIVTTPSSAPLDWPILANARHALRTRRSAILVGGSALDREQLALARRLADATDSALVLETFPSIMDHGAGVANAERLIYLSEFATAQLADIETLVLVGAREPVAFFAYPDLPSRLVAPGCEVVDLAPPGTETRTALEYLVDELDVPALRLERGDRPGAPSGALTTQSLAAAIGATLPEDVIVSDESTTGGVHLLGATRFAPAHRWMTLTGGSIGMGLPLALGAAMASRQRVLAIESDGSMMYTVQALWSMAREGLDVTVVALVNRSYAILAFERERIGASSPTSASQRMLELDDPPLDLCAVATGLGVPSVRVETADDLVSALRRSYATPGPMMIEAILPPGLS
jgi:acetolactate synthase-1/2/3 large subunit